MTNKSLNMAFYFTDGASNSGVTVSSIGVRKSKRLFN